jgi:hypothetical protein
MPPGYLAATDLVSRPQLLRRCLAWEISDCAPAPAPGSVRALRARARWSLPWVAPITARAFAKRMALPAAWEPLAACTSWPPTRQRRRRVHAKGVPEQEIKSQRPARGSASRITVGCSHKRAEPHVERPSVIYTKRRRQTQQEASTLFVGLDNHAWPNPDGNCRDSSGQSGPTALS